MQGVVKSYDPTTKVGVVIRDTDLAEIDMAPDALEGSLFRWVRQGQRIVFHLDGSGHATGVGIGSEEDMGMPAFPERTTIGGDLPAMDG